MHAPLFEFPIDIRAIKTFKRLATNINWVSGVWIGIGGQHCTVYIAVPCLSGIWVVRNTNTEIIKSAPPFNEFVPVDRPTRDWKLNWPKFLSLEMIYLCS